jgi:peptidoglycan/LPS O-acetylase OafA/YrhL
MRAAPYAQGPALASAPVTEAASLESAARVGAASTRFPCFDGLRAVAALAVLVTHVAFITGVDFRSSLGALTARLDAGVVVFFVISGFLLYRPFVAARFAGAPTPRSPAFFWRRALRILPAYWLALTITVFVLDVPPHRPDATTLFLDYTLLHSYTAAHFVGPILSSYTLVTEVAFYLFLPLFALAVGRRAATPEQHLRREVLAVGGLFAAGVAYRLTITFLSPPPARDAQLSNMLPGWIDIFAVGMALAVLSAWVAHRRVEPPAALGRPWAPAAAWATAACAFVVVSLVVGKPPPGIVTYSAGEKLAIHYLYLVVAASLVLPAIFGPQERGAIRALLRNPLAVWLGLVSYGMYLWNETLIEKYYDWSDAKLFASPFAKTLLAVLALTLVAAAISYYVLERPVLRLKDRVPFRRSTVARAR